MPTPDWSFQPEAMQRITNRLLTGQNRVCATGPTGCGKGNLIKDLCQWEVDRGGSVVVYTNRRVIREQLSDRLNEHGIKHGVRASGHRPRLLERVQVSSLDTERHRSMRENHPWELHDATLAIVDEAHSNGAPLATKVLNRHRDSGASCVGFTATPAGIGHLYDELEVIATNTELRGRDVLVRCDVFSPSEIDTLKLDTRGDGDFVEKQSRKLFDSHKFHVFGSILQNFRKINLYGEPSVLFAPGVPESRWFAETLTSAGLRTEHIDAKTPTEQRHRIFAQHRSGEVKVISSYGVIREGWDAPWTSHIILAQPVASPVNFVQMIGRGLRAYPGKRLCNLQDHVGAYWRPGLGSPNQDREWDLNDRAKDIVKAEKKRREDGESGEPVRCNDCGRVLAYSVEGYACVCGRKFKESIRQVFQMDGSLQRQVGTAQKLKKKESKKKTDEFYMKNAIFCAAACGMTVSQAVAMASREKAKATGDESGINRDECWFHVPTRDQRAWDRLAINVWTWSDRSKKKSA